MPNLAWAKPDDYPVAMDPIDSLIGDLNHDGLVNGADLSMLLGSWSTSDAESDLDGSGLVDGADLSRLLANWSTE